MASSFSTSLKLEKMTTGEKAGLWGTVTNTNLDLVEQAVGGYVELSLASGNQTPAISDGAASDGRNKVIKLTGTLSANRSLIFPDSCEKTYLVIDGTTRSSSHYTITIKTSSGTDVKSRFKIRFNIGIQQQVRNRIQPRKQTLKLTGISSYAKPTYRIYHT